jgi:WD40 repeat protein
MFVGAAFGQTLHPEAKLDAPVPMRHVIACEAATQMVAVGEDDAIYTWTLPSSTPRKITIADAKISAIDCAGAHTLAAEVRGGKVLILDAASGEVRQRIDAGAPIQAISLSPDGSLVAIATSLQPTQLWDTHKGTRVATGVTNMGSAWTVAFSPAGDRYVSADEDTNLRAYNREGKLLYAADGGLLEPFTLAFSGDGKQFAAAGADGVIRVFDSTSGKLIGSSKSGGYPVFGLVMSPDGQQVAALTLDDFSLTPAGLGVWNVRSGEMKPLAEDPKSCIGGGTNKSHILLVTKNGDKLLNVSSVQ